MMKKIFTIALLLVSAIVSAQNPLVSAKDFAAELKADKSMIVLDVNAPDVYAKQHIQGSINLFHKDLYKPGAVEGQIKSAEELAQIFGKKGVSNSSRIVVYDDGTNRYNSRVWLILKSVGATNVSILHFNMEQFAAARIPLTATPATAKATTFTATPNADMFCTMADLQKPHEGILLLDNREKDEFEGRDAAKRSNGHIPGAVWLNYKELLTATGAYKSKDEIIATAAQFGATPEKPIVVYCQTGIKAAVVYVALKEIAGFTNVKYYAGAFAEWASVAGNEIVK